MQDHEPDFQRQPTREFTYLDLIISSAKESAIRRGDTSPGWGDVWTAMARSPEMNSAFRARGVNASAFSTEVKYVQVFKPDLNFMQVTYTPEEISDALYELKADLKDLTALQASALRQTQDASNRNGHDDKISQILQSLSALGGEDMIESVGIHHAMALANGNYTAAIQLLSTRIESRKDAVSLDDDHDPERARELKHRLLEHLSQQPLTIELMAHNPETQNIVDSVQTSLIRALKTMLVPAPLELSEGGPKALETLEELHRGPLPVPTDFFEKILKESDPLFEEMLFRHGMRTTDADQTDTLAGALPPSAVQQVMLGALDHAYADNSRKLEMRHIAYQLITDTAVQRHLVKLGIEDLVEFNNRFAECLDPKKDENKGETRISVHPRLPDSIQTTINHLSDVWKKTGRKEELMLSIASGDEEISAALRTAGLTEEMMAGWQAPYKDDQTGKDNEIKVGRFTIAKKPVLTPEQFEDIVTEYCVDQTDLARKGKLDPMIGNEDVINTVITTMIRRTNRNPLITGENGIGKSKIREGLAQTIVAGHVPQELIGARIISLELNKFLKGFGGVQILTSILEYAAENNADKDKPRIILDFDKLPHLLEIGGAGFIQPHLAKEGMLLLATASDTEVIKQIEKHPGIDAMLKRVPMMEPLAAEVPGIIAGIMPRYAAYHGVSAADDMPAFISNQAERYLSNIGQPAKSIDLLDAGMAEAKKAGSATLENIHIHQVISGQTGIPLSYLAEDDGDRYVQLEARLKERVFDQDDAARRIVGPIIRAKSGFKDPVTPIANFLFVGPTGVGKTELATALATFLMGSPEFLVRFDMSDYAEKHNVSRLIGSPPGYANNEEGGKLITEARRKPHAVFLYDEAEKAHPDVFNALLAPFSNGIATDGRGRTGNFRNIINIMTSNSGATAVEAKGRKSGLDPLKNPQEWQEMSQPIYMDSVRTWLTPEFRNRLDAVICFYPLTMGTMHKLVERSRLTTQAQLQANHGLGLELSSGFSDLVIAKGFDVSMGARPLKRAWQEIVEDPLARWLITQKTAQKKQSQAIVMATQDQSPIAVMSFKPRV